MLVDLTAEQDRICAEALSPLQLLRVAHVVAACARMMTTRPLVVVVGGEPEPEHMEQLREVVASMASQVVELRGVESVERVKLELIAALRAARALRSPAG